MNPFKRLVLDRNRDASLVRWNWICQPVKAIDLTQVLSNASDSRIVLKQPSEIITVTPVDRCLKSCGPGMHDQLHLGIEGSPDNLCGSFHVVREVSENSWTMNQSVSVRERWPKRVAVRDDQPDSKHTRTSFP